ncbi:glycosyltransferase [Microbacterium sp. 22242]|uniref:glycosyltransferase n=1 Tax=Microbacterium sp. 22242 TaxID=3453896 RepID=UPI003F85EE86
MRARPSVDVERGDRSLRVVVVAQEPPARKADSAGVGYLRDLIDILVDGGAHVTVIVPETETSRRAATEAAGFALRLVAAVPVATSAGLAASAIGARLAPIRPPRGFLSALRRDPAVRAALRDADVIDVQWPTMAAALPALHRLAPRARLIATLHDVASQGLRRQRRRARAPKTWARFAVGTLQARAIEVRTTALADTIVVFSEKDRALLPSSEHVEVVLPPLGLTPPPPPGSPEPVLSRDILFVGPLYRGENREALRWFAREIWTAVRAGVPDARLLVAGRSTDAHRADYTHMPGIEFLGFVDDLEPLYARAAAVIAPLQVGAGVKFKVVEALVRGVPVIGTSVAFEGIGDDEHRPRPRDDAAGFADALLAALRDPRGARSDAAGWRDWARRHYSTGAFARRVAGIYGLAPAIAVAEDAPPLASVVIPVRDGAHGIARQLSALAGQDVASRLEVIVADNGSTDRTATVALAHRTGFRDLRVVDAGDRPGVNHARNTGLLAARAEKVLFCDHDDEVHAGWAGALIRALDDADVVGGRLVLVAEDAQGTHVTGEVSALRTALGYLPYAVGANFGVRRAAALEIGGFDESFRRGHDEVDFCWRLQQAGSAIAYSPDATVSYRQRRGLRDRARQSYHSARTSILLWTRHHLVGSLPAPSPRRAAINAVGSIRYLPGLLSRARRDESARALGWVWGWLDGQLRYRALGSPPPPVLLTGSRAAS